MAVETKHEQSLLALVQMGLDNTSQGISIFDRDLKLIFVNKKLLTLMDAPQTVIRCGASYADIIRYNAERGEYGPGPIEDLVSERVNLARQFRPHNIVRTRSNGMVLRIAGHPLPGGGFATIYTDITQRRQREILMQTKLEQHSADLRRNKERLSLIANELPAGIAYLDDQMIFRYVNARFAKAYALTPDAIVGMSCHAVLSSKTMALSAPFFATAQQGETVDYEIAVELADGRVLDVRTFLRPDATGKGFYVMSVNVSEHKRATALALQAQKMDALGQLSSGVAHDFNNLLMVILGNLVPLREKIDTKLADELLSPAIRSARRGADLTKRLLAVARRQPLQPATVNLDETIRDMVELISRSLPDSIDFGYDPADENFWTFVDRAQLETVLLNLIVNARDAASTSGVIGIRTVPLKIGERQARSLQVSPGDFVEVSVFDNGSGIEPETLKRVFEPFFTTKTEAQGSGLGLALAYSFTKESGGYMEIESTVGTGTNVTIALPLASSRQAEDENPQETDVQNLKGQLVLLVDDDENIRTVLRRDLVDFGLRVVEAGSSEEALELLEVVHEVDVVLSDIAMPGELSGLDLSARIAASWPSLPVILMTGHGIDLFDISNRPNHVPILQKPFDRSALARMLRIAKGGVRK